MTERSPEVQRHVDANTGRGGKGMTGDGWRDSFVVELRLREVPGVQIGEALAEVDAHCTDSGQPPAEAFGDPVAYAGARAAELAVVKRRGVPLRALWVCYAMVASSLAVFVGIGAVVRETAAELRLGDLVTLVLVPTIIATITLLTLRPGNGRRARVGIGIAGGISVLSGALPPMIWPQVVLTLPGAVLLAAGAVVVAALWWRLTSTALADRVVDPRSGQEPLRVPRWFPLFLRFGPPIILVVGATLLALVPHAQH